ncbi:MAG: AbrB/MazE/SpoVT family DNA-binding domain-containing protein [Candidatus Nanosalina sp.]
MAEFTRQPIKFSAQLDSKGRVTVPAEARDRLGLEAGDRISLGLDSTEVLRREFPSRGEALDFLQGLEAVESFSYDGEVLKVVLSD